MHDQTKRELLKARKDQHENALVNHEYTVLELRALIKAIDAELEKLGPDEELSDDQRAAEATVSMGGAPQAPPMLRG